MMLWMLIWNALFPSLLSTSLAVVLTAVLTLFISHKIFWNRTSRLVHEAGKRAAPCAEGSLLIESVPSGWFNILLSTVWSSLMERPLSHLATERLERAFEKCIASRGKKLPWKLLTQVQVEHVTLGHAPPQFEAVLAKYDHSQQKLHLEAYMCWTASAFQIVLCPVLRSPVFQSFKTRFCLSNLHVRGRLCATFILSPEQPGIKLCAINFRDVPVIDMRITPMGMDLKDFPGIPECLRSVIVRLLTRDMVHPKKLTLDVCRIFSAQRARRKGGNGGLLILNVASVTGMTADVFCECTLGDRTFRTPVCSSEAEWNWNCMFGLDAALPSLLDENLTLQLFDSRSFGEPTLLAHKTISLRDLELENLVSGELSRTVTLEALISDVQPLVHLGFQLTEPTTTPPPVPGQLSETSSVTSPRPLEISSPSLSSSSMRMQETETGKEILTDAEEAAMACSGSRRERHDPERIIETTTVHLSSSSASSGSYPLVLDSAPDLQKNRALATEIRESSTGDSGFANFLRATQVDEALRQERLMYKQRMATQPLTHFLTSEHKTQRDAGYDALIHGGRFIVHTKYERAAYHLWYDPTQKLLNWAVEKSPFREGVFHAAINSHPAHSICRVQPGVTSFPKYSFFGLGPVKYFKQRRKNIQIKQELSLIEGRCLSIEFANNNLLSLEVPPGGNGRDRDAWVEALAALIKDSSCQSPQETI